MENLEKKIKTLTETIEAEEHQMKEQEYGLLGWICPKCGRVYSPYHNRCDYCYGNNTQLWQVTCML